MMKKILLLVMLSFVTLSAEYTKKVKLPTITFEMAKDDNFKAMQRNCQWCHSYGYILNQGKQSKAHWRSVVIKMRDVYRAPISDRDEKITTEYLFKYYGNGKLN